MKRIIGIASIVLVATVIWTLFHWENGLPQGEATNLPDEHLKIGALVPIALPKAREAKDLAQDTVAASGDAILAAGQKYIEAHREELQLQAYHSLKSNVSTSPLGASIAYQIYQGEYPIVGMEIRLRLNRDNQVLEVNNGYRPVANVDLTGEEYLSVPEAGQRIPLRFIKDETQGSVLNAVRELVSHEGEEPELVYGFSMIDKEDNFKPVTLLVKARTGEIISKNLARDEFPNSLTNR